RSGPRHPRVRRTGPRSPSPHRGPRQTGVPLPLWLRERTPSAAAPQTLRLTNPAVPRPARATAASIPRGLVSPGRGTAVNESPGTPPAHGHTAVPRADRTVPRRYRARGRSDPHDRPHETEPLMPDLAFSVPECNLMLALVHLRGSGTTAAFKDAFDFEKVEPAPRNS